MAIAKVEKISRLKKQSGSGEAPPQSGGKSESLTHRQKETLFLLSFGTFLEYFDLMLYVHMAVLLNELFFPQNDPYVAQLLATFTFCSTFLFRPIGGFIIGWIGDHVGRKNTIIITTLLMAFCSVTIANSKTYVEIGIMASVIIVMCRILQGFSSLGESIGASLYVTETLKAPHRYINAGIIEMSARVGALVALLIASFSLSAGLNWRLAFWIGAIVALVGFFARARLRETPEFVDSNRRIKKKKQALNNLSPTHIVTKSISANKEKINKRAVLSYLLIRIPTSACFYISYIYIGDLMKQSLGMTAEEVINQNLRAELLMTMGMVVTIFLVRKYHPLKIAKAQIILFSLFLPFLPYWLNNVSSIFSLTCLQFVIELLVLNSSCAEIPCYKHLPVAKRFTLLATTFGVASALANMIIPFSLIPLTEYFGYHALWIVLVPAIAGLAYGVNYIEKLEKEKNRYHNYPDGGGTGQPDTALPMQNTIFSQDAKRYEAFDLNCKYAQRLLRIIKKQACKRNILLNIKLIEKAVIFAKSWHHGQFRDTGEPFYSHPLIVAELVATHCCKTDVIIAAILHDVVEDTSCPIDLIEQEFNSRIAQLVLLLTRIEYQNGELNKLTLDQVVNKLCALDENEGLLIKQLDRLHNLLTIQGKSQIKQFKTALETSNYLLETVCIATDKLNNVNIFNLENRIFKQCRHLLTKQA